MTPNLVELAEGLSRSDRIVIAMGRTWSAAQRSRLIAKGIVQEAARGAPCFPRKHYESRSWAVPLTPLGHEVLDLLSQGKEKSDG